MNIRSETEIISPRGRLFQYHVYKPIGCSGQYRRVRITSDYCHKGHLEVKLCQYAIFYRLVLKGHHAGSSFFLKYDISLDKS